MSNRPKLEKAILDYRAKVVEMEFISTNAKRDVEFGDGFLFDYNGAMKDIKGEMAELSKEIETLTTDDW